MMISCFRAKLSSNSLFCSVGTDRNIVGIRNRSLWYVFVCWDEMVMELLAITCICYPKLRWTHFFAFESRMWQFYDGGAATLDNILNSDGCCFGNDSTSWLFFVQLTFLLLLPLLDLKKKRPKIPSVGPQQLSFNFLSQCIYADTMNLGTKITIIWQNLSLLEICVPNIKKPLLLNDLVLNLFSIPDLRFWFSIYCVFNCFLLSWIWIF